MNSKVAVAIFCAVLLSAQASCLSASDGTNNDEPHPSVSGIADRFTSDEDKLVDFACNKTSDFYAANGYRNNYPFDCTWTRDNAVIKNGVMTMSVTGGKGNYYGAEYRSGSDRSYGYYSVKMKAAACSGVISSFFTYTGHPKWDEIDIEFLGEDTTKVQFNYYTSGVGGHEYIHELGFDGAEDFHEYGFDWQREYIIWYVDGKAIYKAEENIPSSPQKIMMNVWNGKGDDFDAWCGKLDEKGLPASAVYEWVGYRK